MAPLLPIISVVLGSLSCAPDPWWWLALPGILFLVGWFGTERIWYLRVYRQQPISAAELWRLTWAFFWRFTRLGILASIIWSPIVIIGLQRSADNPERGDEAFADTDLLILSVVLTLIVDFTLTFVTPALAYTTRRVREALDIGIGMLREHWPRCAGYALVPPLAFVAVGRLAQPESVGLGGQMLITVATMLLNLWFKGAVAAFYLRRTNVGDNGAAFKLQEQSPPEVAADVRRTD